MRSTTIAVLAAAALAACGGGEPAATGSVTLGAQDAAAPELMLARRSLAGSSLPRTRLLATPAGRELFAQVVACALPDGAALTAIASDGTPYSFAGASGLAPGWAEHPATSREQRVVAACLRGRVAAAPHAALADSAT